MKALTIHCLAKGIMGVAVCACAFGTFAAEMEQVAYGIKWTYLVSNGKAIITDNTTWVKYPETPVAIKIPSTLGGCPVEKLRKSILHNLASYNVKQLIIPEGVTTIDGHLGIGSTFGGCSNSSITSITLPKTLKIIGPEAFDGVLQGTQLVLPEGLEIIERGAFRRCKMTSITIPASVKKVGDGAFYGCPIKNATINTKIFSQELIKLTKQEYVVFPDDIVEIGKAEWAGTPMKSVKLPRGLKKIADRGFRNCWLEKVEIPNGVTSIGEFAFEGCSGLEVVIIPDSVVNIDKGAFAGWKNLTSVTMPARFKNKIEHIFAYPFTSNFGWTNYQGGEDVPPADIFTFIGSSTASSTSSSKDSDVEDNGNNLNLSDVVGYQGGKDVPPADIFTFIGSSTASSTSSSKDSDVEDNGNNLNLSDVFGYQGDDVILKVGMWMDKMWNEHTEAVCWGGVALVILMLIGSIKNAKKKDKKE